MAKMLQPAIDYISTISNVDVFTTVIVVGLLGMSFWLLRVMGANLFLCCVFMPFLAFGALSGKYLMLKYDLLLIQDKDSSVVFSCGVGMFLTLLALLIVTRAMGIIADARGADEREGTNTLLRPGR